MAVVETHGLTKMYGNKTGCRDVSVTCRKGEIFGFLGPNGAGKSTFVKMLTGLLFPTSGEAYILGKPAGDIGVRKKTGYLPENFKYQEWMTGEDLLSFHASLYRMDKKTSSPRIREVLEITGLKGSEKYRIGTYSKGMQQRIGIAGSLLPDPEVLFLDEPSSALDPVGRKEVRDLMLQLRDDGKTIFLNSHLLSEVEAICDRIAIIKNGSIIKQGSMEDMLEGKTRLHITTGNLTPAALSGLKEFDPELVNSGENIEQRQQSPTSLGFPIEKADSGEIQSSTDVVQSPRESGARRCNLRELMPDSFRHKRLTKLEMSIAGKDEIPSIARLLIENGCSIYELVSRRESLENLFINMVRGDD